MAATLRDVAERAGVSFRTVSNVINGYQYISDSTRAKVEAAIAELEYQPNYSARSLRLGRSNLLGLAVPTLFQGYYAELASEIIDQARKRGYTVLTEQTNSTRDLEIDALHGARRQMTDGLLINPLALNSDDAALFNTKRPVVLLGDTVFSSTIDHVTIKNVEAAASAVELLIRLGHRRIAIIGVADEGTLGVGTSAPRMAGYHRALADNGIERDQALELSVGTWRREDGAAAVQQLLQHEVEFDAVFALTDILAIGAMHELQSSGIAIPADVSVLGFDDLVESRYTVPELSTVGGGRRLIAEAAVRTLIDRIENPQSPPVIHEVDFAIIQRGSTRRRP